MKTVRITKSFPLNKVGTLREKKEIDLNDATADYIVKKMNAGEYVKTAEKTKEKFNKKNAKK